MEMKSLDKLKEFLPILNKWDVNKFVKENITNITMKNDNIDKKEYYHPSLDEFYEGFEYEKFHSPVRYKIQSDEYYNKWEPKVYSLVDEEFRIIDWELHDNNKIIDKQRVIDTESLHWNWIRVKFLDKEDILSLGWTFVSNETNDYWYKDTFEITYNDNSIKFKDTLIFTKKPDKQFIYNNISISQFNNKKIGFNGTIKNKSELKKLMQQLLIID
jgi:hypothetical protein